MISNMIYIVALGVGLKCPRKIHLNTQSSSDQLNISSTFFSSKLDSPVIKTLERIRFSSNQNIGEGESNFDEKNVKEMFN